MFDISVVRLKEAAILPTYGSAGAAGADLYACLEQPVTIAPGESAFVPTGLAMQIPEGYVGLIYARSGLACKRGLAPANKVGVIDSDYRGEFIAVLHNHGSETQTVWHGERVAQLVIAPVVQARFCLTDALTDTQRSAGGFGSTGK